MCSCRRACAEKHASATEVGVVDVNRASRDIAFAIGRYGPHDCKKRPCVRTGVEVRARYGENVGAIQIAVVEASDVGRGRALLLEPQLAMKRMLAIAVRAMSRRPAHLVAARGFIRHSCL